MAETSSVIEQTLHGYGHGHELLAATSVLDNAAANLLSHNSDSAPNAAVGDGPFLTGYPLPDGRYVIARTWADEIADRPNTVITLSVILPAGADSSFSMERLLRHLAKPPQPVGHTLPSIDRADLAGPPLQLSPAEAAVAAEFYTRPRSLYFSNPSSRERIALAVWQQLWRSARYGLQFCTAPDTDRFAKSQRPLRFQTDPTPPPSTKRGDCIIEDLQDPGPFRVFAHFVGSGERAVGLMQPFALTYTLLTQGRLTPDAFAQVLVDYKGNEPRRLRRLKRRVAGFHRGEAAWRIEPFVLLDAFATHDLGHMIYASDASLDTWLRTCWDVDPRRTVDTLRSVVGGPEPPAGPPTAREGLIAVFDANATDLISSNTLAIAATLHRDVVLRTIWASNDRALWGAWGDLEPPIDVPYGDPSPDFRWETVLQAVRNNSSALSRILRRHPEALDHLIVLVDSDPQPTDLTLDLTAEAKRLISFRLEHDGERLVGLARLADGRSLPRALQSEPWVRIVKKSKDEVVHAVGYLIARTSGPVASDVVVQTFSWLYRTLNGDGGIEAWERLQPQVRGDRSTWDRCARLTEDFVHVLRSYPADDRSEAITALRKSNATAANAVERRVRSEVDADKRKKFRIWDPTTW